MDFDCSCNFYKFRKGKSNTIKTLQMNPLFEFDGKFFYNKIKTM